MLTSIQYLALLCCIANSTVVFSSEAAKKVPQVPKEAKPKQTLVAWKPDTAYQTALENSKRERVHQRGKKRARLEQRLFVVKDQMVQWTEYKKTQDELLNKQKKTYNDAKNIITQQLGSLFNAPLQLLEQHKDYAEIKSLRDLLSTQRKFLQEQEEIHYKTVGIIDARLLPLCIERRALERAIHNIDTGYQWKSKQ